MNKTIILLFALLAITLSFNIRIRNQDVNIIEQSGFQAIPWNFTLCGESTKWKIQKLTLASQPARNTNDDIVVTGTAKGSITFSKVHLDVKINGAPLHNEDITYTESYDSGDAVEFKYKNYIPSFAPPGTYGLQFNFKDKSGADQGCMSFQFKL